MNFYEILCEYHVNRGNPIFVLTNFLPPVIPAWRPFQILSFERYWCYFICSKNAEVILAYLISWRWPYSVLDHALIRHQTLVRYIITSKPYLYETKKFWEEFMKPISFTSVWRERDYKLIILEVSGSIISNSTNSDCQVRVH